MDARVEALERAIGDGVATEFVRNLAAVSVEWEAEPGEMLMSEGQVSGQGFLIVEGTATVHVDGRAVARLGPGSWVWSSDYREAMPADVVADGPMWLLVLAATDVDLLLRTLASPR